MGDGKGAAMDLLSKRIGDLTPTQMFDVVRELKEMAEGDPVGTRNLLSANPQLCLAAFQCQLALGMVKVPVMPEKPQQQQQQVQQQPDQAQLLAQVMVLTPQQIAALPPD